MNRRSFLKSMAATMAGIAVSGIILPEPETERKIWALGALPRFETLESTWRDPQWWVKEGTYVELLNLADWPTNRDVRGEIVLIDRVFNDGSYRVKLDTIPPVHAKTYHIGTAAWKVKGSEWQRKQLDLLRR